MAISPTGTAVGAAATRSSSGSTVASNNNPMQAWWETIAKARSAIQALISILGNNESYESLLDSESPAKALLDSREVAEAIATRFLRHPSSGSASDPLCRWLYETFQTQDADLHLVVLRYVPLVAGLYLSRVVNQHEVAEQQAHPLAGFEAVLLALYTVEAKARGGRPVLIHVPDLAQPSLYHAPRNPAPEGSLSPIIGQLCAPLEPHGAVKSTKRAFIVGVALDLFNRKIALMPAEAKVEACEFVQGLAGQNCQCARCFEDEFTSENFPDTNSNISSNLEHNPNTGPRTLIEELRKFGIEEGINGGSPSPSPKGNRGAGSGDCCNGVVDESRAKGARVPLNWELLQPMLRILGHCLLGPLNPQEVKDAASSAVRVLFARVSHDLVPEAILATRSLVRLDVASRASAARVAAATADASASKNSTPTKRRKPEMLLVSK
ncbi:hypothetical protein SUGI_0591640 [Cryptomeria japonica]|uniref:uncharacterized protein LOC131050132 isoform X3 n=1 Tax=Cryptomeria japonica TaxID=3369 RepID=UPI002414952C|nr:uncharacterized protein LOC131050132 isoform X3 [Cryptomeria japonica]XP_057840285.2 uncharacterized protein LOC131050132 isoform X2 [Cryptomeria japonica]XP_059063177.1 uncharacterized protein LOC131050132 isoform X2 [Cryptomeria japonica]GLJ29925.1 hypothetical protein SUGI_0591640 [Cryptomeria japonica]